MKNFNLRHQTRSPFVILLLATLLHSRVIMGMQAESQEVWGTNSVVLGTPWSGSPSTDDLLADQEHGAMMGQFYRVGGVRTATPTECRVSYNNDTLFVVFRCEDHTMSFPAPIGLLKPNWNALLGSPGAAYGANGGAAWPPYPDEVDFFVQPNTADTSCYQFAVTLDGLKLACHRAASAQPDKGVRGSELATNTFEASVTRGSNEWTVVLQIPWKTVGGKPDTRFGFLPVRTRLRDGEFSSPVALDFSEWLPVDLFIEADFAGGAAEQASYQTSLCRLPSGILRWQRPAMITHGDADTLQQIWQMESSLGTPTDMSNFGQRLYLTQRWMDTMMLEGFTPLPRAWSAILTNDLTLRFVRESINTALRKNETEQACKILDTYLGEFDQMSKWWYADGSPGDILKEEWTPVATVESLEVKNKVLLMRCQAGSHEVDLHLALPKTGGVRIYGDDEGYWKPAALLPIKATQTASTCSIKTADGSIVISRSPFSISFSDATGNEVTRLGANDLAFRYGADGKIIAVDFRNQLDPNEVIYGFGEKYDHFNQNGNVLTLWGSDDWIGNGMGLRDTTYKLVPVIHSSKGYMIFDDSTYRLRADVGVATPDQYRITQPGPVFDYYFWTGTPEKTLQSDLAMTGTPPLPTKWVFEPWMGRGGGAWNAGPFRNAYREETNTYMRFVALDIPHSAIYAEGDWRDPVLNQFMAAHGIKVLGYFSPPQGRQAASLMPELKANQLPILNGGSPRVTSAMGYYVDFTNPNALEFIRRWWKQGLDLGVAGSMVDFGDMVADSAVFYDGKRGDEMHNFYSYAYHKTVSEVFQERRGNDFILYGRAAAPGTQHWVGQFAGDHSSDFDGLRAVMNGALSLCSCGFSLWGSDLGGYFGFPEPAVYMRWIEFGLFSPLWRPHGKAPRDPWYFGDAAVASYKYDAWARENLLNYFYNAAAEAHDTGIPMMRAMPLAFPGEPSVAAVGDEYMFGDDLLIAPVVNEDNFRTISFPSGVWTGLWDGKTVTGPAEVKTDVPLDVIPAYLRPGAVMSVELNRELKFGESMTSIGRPLEDAPMVNRVSALVVTPPGADETVTLLNAQNKAAKVTVKSTADGIDWKLENLPETDYVLVYGTTKAGTVKVDGKVVPQGTDTEYDLMPEGCEADMAGNRLVIRLPSAQAGHDRGTTEIEVDSNPGKQ